jgi:ArsR family transcriptional regulator, arsenate/arsenite/antimonite-responsive transcriptional repressor
MSSVSTPAASAPPLAPLRGRPVLPLLDDLAACCVPLSSALLPLEGAVPLATAFSALGDPVRLRMVSLLMTAPGGAVCACDLVEPVGKSQPTVSHHLKVLRDAGLVTATRKGANIWYAVVPEQLSALRDVLAPARSTDL